MVSLFIWIYILDVYFYISTSFDTTFNTQNVRSMRTSKADRISFWKKIVLVIFFSLFDNITKWGLICVISFISLLSFFIYSKELPDYNPILLNVKLISRAIFLWSGICLVVNKIIQSVSEFESGIILFIIGVPLIFGIFHKGEKGKIKKLLVHHSKFQKSNEFLNRIFLINELIENFDSRYAQFTLRGYVNKMEEFCTLENCPLKKYLSCINNKEEAICYLFMYIESVFQFGISKNPTDITLRIFYIQFLIGKMNKIHKAYLELNYCEYLDKNIEIDFIIYRHKKQFSENGDFNFSEEVEEGGLNLLYQNNFSKFKNLIIKVSFLYIDFWSLLYENQMEEQQDMSVLNDYGNKINIGVEEIHKLFNKLQKIKENKPELLELYSDFLKEIRADYEQSKELNLILDKVQKRLKNDDMDELNWINSFNIDIYALNNSDKNLYLVFDTKLNNFGTILNVSLGLCSILGYNKEELKGKHINLLIPDIFHSSHQSLLNKLIVDYQKDHRSKKKIDFSKSDSFAVNKSKYLVPFNFKACVISTDSEYFWLLKVNKESSYFTNYNSIDLNDSNYNTYTIITNKQFIIHYFTSNCVKFFGLKASEIVGVCDISYFIKEFHEELIKRSKENEELTLEEKLKIKQKIVKQLYHNQTQITWYKRDPINKFRSSTTILTEKKKDIKILYLTCSEIIIDGHLDGYNFKLETSPHQNYFSSTEEQSYASKSKVMSHENSISKKSSKIQTNQTQPNKIEKTNTNKTKKTIKFENQKNCLSPMQSLTSNNYSIIERNFIPKIPKVGGFKFNPQIISYQINVNETNKNRRKLLKEKALNKIKEINTVSSNKSESSGEEFTENSEFSNESDESSVNEKKKRNSIKNNTIKVNEDEYYKINFSKIRLKVYDYKSNGFIEKKFEKKSKVEIMIENNHKGEYDDNEFIDNPTIKQAQTKEENEKEFQQKKEMLLQQIQKSLLQEDSQTSITNLRIISFIIFLSIIGYGIIFLFILKKNFNLYKDKYLYIKFSYQIYRGILHSVSLVREYVIVSFEEYTNMFSTKEQYRKTLIDSLTNLYIRMSDYIDQLTKKSSQLSEENYQTVFGTILPTYIINYDFSVNIFNLTYISTVSKAVTSLFEITQLSEDQIMPLNKDIYFFITNTFNGILSDTRIAEKTYTAQLNLIIKEKKKLLLILFIVISIINLSTYLIINKAFMNVEARKNSYLEVFYEIKGNLIISSLTKCENFVKRLQNIDGEDILSIENDDDENDEGDNTIQSRKIHSDNDGNKVTSNEAILINSIVFGMLLFIVFYLLTILLLFYDFSKNTKNYLILFNHESRLEMEQLLAYSYIREYIFDSNSIVNSKEIKNIIVETMKNYTLNQIDDEFYLDKYQYLYSKNYSELRHKVYRGNICNYFYEYFQTFFSDDSINCYSFLFGAAQYGLEIIHSNFYQELRSIKAERERYLKVWKQFNFSYNLTLYGTSEYHTFKNSISNNETLLNLYVKYSPLNILISDKMKKVTIAFEYLLCPIYIEIFDSISIVINDYFNNKQYLILGMCIAYIVLFVFIYLFIWRRYVENLNIIIYQTKRMLAIIPKDILASLRTIGKLLDIKTQAALKTSSDHKPMKVVTKTKKKPNEDTLNNNINNNNINNDINDNINNNNNN